MIRLLLLGLAQDLSLEGLRSDDPAVRDGAEAALKTLPLVRTADLRTARSAEKDPEVRARLQAIVAHRVRRESEALYQDGRLVDSLKKELEAEGVVEVEVEHARRWKAARKSFDGCLPIQSELPIKVILDPAGDAAALLKAHGRWALAVPIDALRDDQGFEAWYHAFQILRKCGKDLRPTVRAALRTSGGDAKLEFRCMDLMRDDAESLRHVRDDENLNATVRGLAAEFLNGR
jgi:hypothetical protein